MRTRTFHAIAATAALLAGTAHASYFGLTKDTPEAQQCITYDARYPYWTDHIYIATYPGHSRSKEGWIAPYYGGIVSNTRGEPNLIQYASWQMGGKGAPASGIDFVHAGKHMSWVRSTWEGSSGGIKGLWPTSEFKPGKWYRFFHRVWTPADPVPHTGYAGVWMKDLESGVWYHLATFKFPAELTGFDSMGGFCEYITGSATRTCAVEFRNIYAMRNGKWGAENTFKAFNHKEDIIKLTQGDPGSVLLETSRTDRDPQTGRHAEIPVVTQTVSLKQPADIRFLDPVRIAACTAEASGNRCVVRWKVSEKDSPQLGYRVEVTDGAQATVTAAGNDPNTRELVLETPPSNRPFRIKLVINDIFGRESQAAAATVTPVRPAPAVIVDSLVPGLAYRYFESAKPAEWQTIPDTARLQPKRQGVVAAPDITPRLKRVGYAFDFQGFLNVPAPGLYQFNLVAASGVRLLIDGRPVVNAADYHSIARSPGTIALAAGLHRLEIGYFQGARQYQQADDFLQLSWNGPGLSEQTVPFSAFLHQPQAGRGNEPQVTLKSAQQGDAGIRLLLSAEVTPGTAVERIEYYAHNPHFDYYSAQGASGADYLLATATDPAAATPVVVWGGGGSLRARLVYGQGLTADSAPLPLPAAAGRTPDLTFGPYRLTELEHHLYPMACAADADSITLVGDSMGLLTKPLDGDGTVTAHLAEITSNQPQADGTTLMDDQNWYAGIIIRDRLDATPGEPLGGDKVPYAAVLGAANDHTRYCDSTMINGAGNQPANAGRGTRWFRIERKGNSFTLFHSADGADWKSIKTVDLPKMSPTAQAGFVIYSIPCATNKVHSARFDHISIQP